MKFFPSLLLVASLAHGDPAFFERAASLIDAGRLDDAASMTKAFLADHPDDTDALLIAGTVVLYQGMEVRYDDSIFRPNVEGSAAGEPRISPQTAATVAAYWKRIPSLDPSRGYLWGDLAQMTYRSGDTARALEFASLALADRAATSETLRSAGSVFALNLDWQRAAQAFRRIPGDTTADLYEGLDAWRTGKDGWKIVLKAFVDSPGNAPGKALAAYLIGPAMRDTEAGFLAAFQTEQGLPTLAVRQKYAERYPNKFQPQLDLARGLSQYGSFTRALNVYAEMDRKALAVSPEEKLSVLFQEAWANQAAARPEAVKLWALLADSRDFYIRSAAAWFLGKDSLDQGKTDEAKASWAAVADEPARSKYAYWAAAELKKLSPAK